MKNLIIICILAAVFDQIRSAAITNHSCSSIQVATVVVNVSAISGNYFGCVDSPNKPPASKQCISLNLEPTSSNSWNSRLFSISNETGKRESFACEATIKNQEIELKDNSLNSTMPRVTFTLLDTNNDYLIYLGCNDEIKNGWISYLAKTQDLCSTYRYKLDEAIDKYGLKAIPLVQVNHDNCGSYEV
uniref:Teratocyte protein IV n=1 Tax=Cotesia flavipes TaxID=89805 RepID=A0A8K1YTU4_COTFL|nr:teratocyte protein IV [Cotesia flavipes]